MNCHCHIARIWLVRLDGRQSVMLQIDTSWTIDLSGFRVRLVIVLKMSKDENNISSASDKETRRLKRWTATKGDEKMKEWQKESAYNLKEEGWDREFMETYITLRTITKKRLLHNMTWRISGLVVTLCTSVNMFFKGGFVFESQFAYRNKS